ncbi:hypothetical protein GIB67_004452 [Kingdonia uniflora]|uniref:Uncharacterized protein n=1 Tax=Kingdonia uniflora TaxID=39325 RepID=A0A7J7MRN4_9MAGN|nr:hypothetical protein GIB67_004452 [Kingdonia uniflora]
MVSTSGCAKADEVDLVRHLSPVIGVGDEEDIVAELVEWPRLKGSRVEYAMGCSRFREFFILVCETLNEIWAASGSESRITAKDFLEYYAVKYVTTTDGAYLSSSSSRPCFFDLASAGRVWNNNILWVSGECLQQSNEEPLELNNRTITKGISCKVSRKESFIDFVAKEGTELEFARVLRGVQLGLQDRSIELERRISQLEEEKNQFEESLTREREAFQLELKKEMEAAALKLKEVRAESVAEAERLVSASATSRNNLAEKLYQLRYTKAEILAFSEGNYEEKEIVNE